MTWRREGAHQAGFSRLRFVLLLVLASAVYGAVKFAPPYIRNYQLENAFDDEARRAHLVGDEELRANVLRKAHAIGFTDWEPADITVVRDEASGEISISAEYEVPVELFWGRVVVLRFAPDVDRMIDRR